MSPAGRANSSSFGPRALCGRRTLCGPVSGSGRRRSGRPVTARTTRLQWTDVHVTHQPAVRVVEDVTMRDILADVALIAGPCDDGIDTFG